jgi:4-alpha-glucanotransferase
MARTSKQATPNEEIDVGKTTDSWGIDPGYEDVQKQWHSASAETLTAIRRAMGAVEKDARDYGGEQPVVVIEPGTVRQEANSRRRGSIQLETGGTVDFETNLPANLPAGYHRLSYDGADQETPLIVSPGECYLPRDLKTWGWAMQLYATRSSKSWGIGDLRDLETVAKWAGEDLGAGMLLLNPLSTACPFTPQQASPYYPSSRRFFNPLWICVESMAGANEENVPGLEAQAAAAQRLNQQRRIDRDRVFTLKMKCLNSLWAHFPGDPAFTKFCREQGADLDRFATFCALAEQHQSGWHAWPEPYRHPSAQAVAQYAGDHRQRVDFHKWLQWTLDTQLAQASRHVALMQDLPIGVDPDGADAWAWQDVMAQGASVGAPPDEFNTQGQNWGLPPFVPHKLRGCGYQPFIQTLRAAFRHGGGLRIDHVMGLFRLYWIPQEMSPKDGAYVRYNADEMLAIVALESQRARAYVVGEDLGTVEDEAREKLANHCILSYRLLWFEKEHPARYPVDALAAITTHDLPTVAGLWTGSDLARQHELALTPNEDGIGEIHRRLDQTAELNPHDSVEDVIAKAYQLLAAAPSRIVTAALDDAAAVEERPNIPATLEDRNPNWSLALPVPIEDLMRAELPGRIARALRRSGESS